jgi:cysteine desulfurase family protein
MAIESQRAVGQCRRAVAELLGAPSPDHVVFALNATDALNIAIKGLVRPGDHVLTTMMEHNSVVRPLEGLRRIGVELEYIAADGEGRVSAEDILRAVRPDTRLVVMAHASNVVGTIQPVEAVAAALRDTSTYLLVDAAQTAGALPISVADTGIDLLAFAGHKGPLGPPGTGGLVLGGRALPQPLREGGTGTVSESRTHPEELPERLEAGTLNVSGLVGLLAGVDYLLGRSVADVRSHERGMASALHNGLASITGVAVHGPTDFDTRVGPVSFSVSRTDPREVATILDASFGIASRAGLHCAPLAHQSLGTHPAGTVRLSPGPFTTTDDVSAALGAVSQIAAALT